MKIGIALSGGGSRGFAHLGALKALGEAGIKADILSGTSAGSIVAALTAAGYSPDFIFETIQQVGVFNSLKFAFNRFGLFKLEKLEETFLQYIPHNSFEKLKVPLTICATDILHNEAVYFNQGELIKPIIASCSIPGIFEPVSFAGRTLVDGGILDNMPIRPIEAAADFIIGINVMPIRNDMPVRSAKDILMKSLYLAIGKNTLERLNLCNLVIEPEALYHYDGLNASKAKEIFQIGYEKTLQVLEQNQSSISKVLSSY